jgi:hypothetical protein
MKGGKFVIVLSGLLIASVASAWTGPTAAPPSNNISAPINVSSAAQAKAGTISVTGSNINGVTAAISGGSGWGGFFTGQSGVYGEGNTGIGVQGRSSGGSYGGYFTGQYGVYAANASGQDVYLAYPGWSVYAPQNIQANDYYIASVGRWASDTAQYGPRGSYYWSWLACDSSTWCNDGSVAVGAYVYAINSTIACVETYCRNY